MMLTREQLIIKHELSAAELAENVSLFSDLSSDNDPLGHCWLGMCYYQGTGLKRDKRRAFELYNLASKHDYPLGHCFLGKYFKDEDAYEYVDNMLELYERASEQDHPLGHCLLGEFYDIPEIDLYQRASDQNYPLGHCLLGTCYQYGYGVDKNIDKAVELYQRSVDMGSFKGMHKLGLCYQYGWGVDEDVQKAMTLYKQAFKGIDMVFVDIRENLDKYSLNDLNELIEICKLSTCKKGYKHIIQEYIYENVR